MNTMSADVEYDAETKPSRSERRASARAQRDLVEGERDNGHRNRLIGLLMTLVFLVLISITFNWYVSGVRNKAFREGQNSPSTQVTQAICTEAYAVGVDGRTEPQAVAGTRGNDLNVTGRYCNFSELPVPPTTKSIATK